MVNPIEKGLKVTVLAIVLLLLLAPHSFGEDNSDNPLPAEDDTFSTRPLGPVITQVKDARKNVWERIEKAPQWVWDEYPDQVLIEEPEIKWPRYLSAIFNTPSWLDLAVSTRLRREGFDFPFQADQDGSTWQWAQRSRFRASARWRAFRSQLEFQGSTSGEDANTDVLDTSTFDSGNIQQLFVSFTSPNVLESGLRTDLHVGRINLDLGSRRLVARSRFGNTSQAFDGIHWNLASKGLWQFRAFFSEVVFNEDTTQRLGLFTNSDALLWGLSYETQQLPWSKIHLYYYGTDWDTENDRPSRTHSTFGLRAYQSPKIGHFNYDGESVWQVGTFDGMDHFAFFQHVSFGYTFDIPWSPRILAMYDYASGTDNPNGNKSESFDPLFGARRFELAPTSLFGPFFRSNISSPGVRLILKPLPLVRLHLKFRAWYLAQSRDEWAGSGLQDPTGSAGNVLGQDMEVRIQWDPSPNLRFHTGYDRFFKGSYISRQADVPGNPPANDTNYFYVQSEVRF